MDRTVADLLLETWRAHHHAFASTDGADPEWARWYAEYLTPRLAEMLGTAFLADALAADLTRWDEEHRASGSDAPWSEVYARNLLSPR
jgi:NAD(P)H-hydrate epimerase